ncbi:glycerophosphodiester phosphodiesterase [Marinobacter daepoensis]|uniref:glycerophosphodiester phosphodiesterase n=1 Tax=Marinobacter daepoensis TaxID=262077 RepID=A0ABS3BE84_9GAMM|nr:glycerophosphodiester phosphodiesterase family protein [Marinobacter daepoensis]MBN7770145.1 glycerophosphodiester phosphodiesterase [Marinobacter daepoensis]MBY6033675.1 glycerophosphodiester phosphodiesterase [Marinobacter daepoensis]MBY6079591.1 glycerophosphodiester phosphodiesterase [Marinobacter daepoensis]
MKLRVLTGLVLSTLVAGAAYGKTDRHDVPGWQPPGQEKRQGAGSWGGKPAHKASGTQSVQVGARPYWLVDNMDEGPLKEQLESCKVTNFRSSDFSIGHRGAPLQFPEHTRESYVAAARMGAGILECDVAFTKDRELVCRHAQNDLHTTTNIVTIPELNAKCTQPFVPADPESGTPAKAECRTSDITLAEFKRLEGKMDAYDPMATTPEEFVGGTADWRTDLYASRGTLLSHRESIELFKSLGVKFTPELKSPVVDMPFDGDYSQQDYARQMIQDYRDAGVRPEDVWPQSFNLDDVLFWVNETPRFGKQAVFLDQSPITPETASLAYMESLKARGVNVLAPALWKMLALDSYGEIVPSEYARNARVAGLDMIAWSIERSGPLETGGGWYYQTVNDAINNDGDVLNVIDVLAQDVGVIGIFSDWPATTTFYANCMNGKQGRR